MLQFQDEIEPKSTPEAKPQINSSKEVSYSPVVLPNATQSKYELGGLANDGYTAL